MSEKTKEKDTEKKPKDKTGQNDQNDEPNSEQEKKEEGPQWLSEIDSYPLREKDKDPRWAIRTVWVWIGFAIASLIFILTLLVLGAIYD